MPQVYANGAVTYYRICGKGSPVLFLHGSGTSQRLWEPQVEALMPHHTMLLPDLRGHGQSAPLPPTGPVHELMAQDMDDFLDALGYQRVDVVGISLGAAVAMLLALRYPRRVNRMVLAGAYSELPSGAARWLGRATQFILSPLSAETVYKLMMRSTYRPGEPGHDLTISTLNDAWTMSKPLLQRLNRAPYPYLTPLLKKIKALTLVLTGDTVAFEQRSAEVIAEAIPGAQLAVFHGAYSPLNTMRHTLFNQLVLDFLAGRVLTSEPELTISRLVGIPH